MDLYSRNVLPILKVIQQDLQKYNLGPFSWFGREAVIKMNILYLFQTLPIKIPVTFFSTYKQICKDFTWASKHTRIGWGRLMIPKLKGGIELPDVHKYYWSCRLTRIVDWHVHVATKDWVGLEESFSHLPICHLPWISPNMTPKESTVHHLIGSTLQIFWATCKKIIPDFSPGLTELTPLGSHTQKKIRAETFSEKGKLIHFQTLSSRCPDQSINFFKFLQSRHFLNSSKPLSKW